MVNKSKINDVFDSIKEEYKNAKIGEYKVYYHQNKTNNKIYVGVTRVKNINRRWRKGKGYKHNIKFYKDIIKYGWNGFNHVVLVDGISKDDAFDIEKKLISSLFLIDDDYGYNVASGGIKNYSYPNGHCEDAIKHMSSAQKKRFEDKKNHPWTGKHHSYESICKMRDNNQSCIKVMCVETGVIYKSINDATRMMNLKSKNSIKCALDKSDRTSCGYHWITVNNKDGESYEKSTENL